jgi:hypothetical protein
MNEVDDADLLERARRGVFTVPSDYTVVDSLSPRRPE